jgi:hypothetical protein
MKPLGQGSPTLLVLDTVVLGISEDLPFDRLRWAISC